ncbi:MAG: SIR2 family NAD-dependent protein deacylase [Planctomycetota bacterium]|jgi:NAD-dependent deacetylase
MDTQPTADEGRRAAAKLAEQLRELGEGSLLVVTGAGISLASGIPTFRGTDPDAIWKHDVTELGTRRYFEQDPAASWNWYLSRFDAVLACRPNPAHEALVRLERWHLDQGGRFLLVTQNIDTLHEQAGSQQIVKVHGSADQVRCSRHGCVNAAPRGTLARQEVDVETFRAEPSLEHVPCCPECGEHLRPHVLWFDEYYHEHEDYQVARVEGFGEDADVTIFVGTSLAVGITDMILGMALRRGRPVYLLDPTVRGRLPNVHHISLKAEEALPELCAALGAT